MRRAACTAPSRSATHALLSSRAAMSLYPSSESDALSTPSDRSTHEGINFALYKSNGASGSALGFSSGSAKSTFNLTASALGRWRFGRRPSRAPSCAISHRTLSFLRPRSAMYACHFRHSTSELSTRSSFDTEVKADDRGGAIQSVGVSTFWEDLGVIAGYVCTGK